MNKETIKCPECGAAIELSDAISVDMEKEIRKKYDLEMGKLRAEEQKKLDAKEEAFLRELEKEKAKARKLRNDYEDRLDQEKKAGEERARKKAEESIAAELRALQEEVQSKGEMLAEARKQELDLRKKQRELEDRERALELEMRRKMDAEMERLKEQIRRQHDEAHRLRDAEKDKQLADMKKQIDELRRKAEQGSQQLQGEVLELELEKSLREEFPYDDIEPVGKGVRGADIIHTIKTRRGNACGKILWETKRTKNWNEAWLQKLKDDQRECKASLAVLVSETLPPGFHHFKEVDGIWVTDVESALSLAIALRMILIQETRARQAELGRQGKMEDVYTYVTGQDFRQRVEAILEGFTAMREELESEKRAMQRIWSSRTKQIEKVISNTAGLYGDLEGLAGPSLQSIRILELPTKADD